MSKVLLSIWTYLFILNLFTYLYLLILNIANDIVRSGFLADNNVIPGNHIGGALPYKNKIEE